MSIIVSRVFTSESNDQFRSEKHASFPKVFCKNRGTDIRTDIKGKTDIVPTIKRKLDIVPLIKKLDIGTVIEGKTDISPGIKGMLHLPNELFAQILGYFSIDDEDDVQKLLQMRRISRGFNAAICDHLRRSLTFYAGQCLPDCLARMKGFRKTESAWKSCFSTLVINENALRSDKKSKKISEKDEINNSFAFFLAAIPFIESIGPQLRKIEMISLGDVEPKYSKMEDKFFRAMSTLLLHGSSGGDKAYLRNVENLTFVFDWGSHFDHFMEYVVEPEITLLMNNAAERKKRLKHPGVVPMYFRGNISTFPDWKEDTEWPERREPIPIFTQIKELKLRDGQGEDIINNTYNDIQFRAYVETINPNFPPTMEASLCAYYGIPEFFYLRRPRCNIACSKWCGKRRREGLWGPYYTPVSPCTGSPCGHEMPPEYEDRPNPTIREYYRCLKGFSFTPTFLEPEPLDGDYVQWGRGDRRSG